MMSDYAAANVSQIFWLNTQSETGEAQQRCVRVGVCWSTGFCTRIEYSAVGIFAYVLLTHPRDH